MRQGLKSLMSRRHQIAHRLDRNDATGRGHHAALSIGKTTIERWIGVVRRFGDELLAEAQIPSHVLRGGP